jgi:hypothetical protein
LGSVRRRFSLIHKPTLKLSPSDEPRLESRLTTTTELLDQLLSEVRTPLEIGFNL